MIPIWLVGAALVGGGSVALAATAPIARRWLPLDPTVTPQERTAITFAFLYEVEPAKLRAYAQALRPDLFASADLLDYRAHAPRGVQTVGDITDLDNYTDFASDVASGALNVLTNPADTASGAWHAITHPGDSIADFGNGLVDALHAIPGMNEAGELLKDFAHTAVGEWCLRVMATFGYYVTAPYLGAQLAAVSFALPGAARSEPFLQSWITETIDRLIKTINILLQQEGLRNVGGATSEALNKILAESPAVQSLAKDWTEQIGRASNMLTDRLGAEIAKKIKDAAGDAISSVQSKLAEEFGSPPNFQKIAAAVGIREDNAAAAYDQLAHTSYQSSIEWDPATGEDIYGHLNRARMSAAGTQSGTLSGEGAYHDPRFQSIEFTLLRNAAAVDAVLHMPPRRFWTSHYLARYLFAQGLANAAKNGHLFAAAQGFEESAIVQAATSEPVVQYAQQFPSGGFSSGRVSR